MAYYKCGSIHPTQNSNVVVDTASGAIANFETPLAMPLLDAQIGVNAVQEPGTPTPDSPKAISGISEVSVVQCQKNFFNLDYLSASGITIQNGEASGTANKFDVSFPSGIPNLKFKQNTQYTLTFKAYTDQSEGSTGTGLYWIIRYTDGTQVTAPCYNNENTYTEHSRTTASGKTVELIKLSYGSSGNNIWYLKDIQLEENTEATTYEPFNGTSHVIQLGDTYYGGEFVQKGNKRQFIATFGMSDMGDLMYMYILASDPHLFAIMNLRRIIKLIKKDSDPQALPPMWWNGLCSCYKIVDNIYPNHVNNHEMSLCTRHESGDFVDGLIYFRDNEHIENELKAALAGQKIIYELATPTIIDLPDGTPFKTIAGTNNISCDTGDTSVKFRKIQTTG